MGISLDPLNLDGHLLDKLSQWGIFFLSQVISHWHLGCSIWKSTSSLGLRDDDGGHWMGFVKSLQVGGLCLHQGGDRIIWEGASKGNAIIVAETYQHLIYNQMEDKSPPLPSSPFGLDTFHPKSCYLDGLCGKTIF